MEKIEKAQKIIDGQKPVRIGKKVEETGQEREKKEKAGMSRRDFLKLAGAGAALGAASYLEKKYGWVGNFLKVEPESQSHDDNGEKAYPWDKENYPDDSLAVDSILRSGSWDTVEINEETARATEGYWYKRYKEDPKYRDSLEHAYVEMKKWEPLLRNIFVEEFQDLFPGKTVPKEFSDLLYLAIPESHWNWKKNSPKGAAGPYQFTVGSAKLYDLKVSPLDKKTRRRAVDERLDVLASARAAAKHLKDLYKKTNDWDLTLSGYNGGFIWKYLAECSKNQQKPNYLDFLKYIENKVNDLKRKISRSNIWHHKVGKKETLESIACLYRLKKDDLIRINQSVISRRNRRLFVAEGQKLTIPMRTLREKEIVYKKETAGYVENLNYPPKYNAVMKIINESEFQEKMKKRPLSKIMLARK